MLTLPHHFARREGQFAEPGDRTFTPAEAQAVLDYIDTMTPAYRADWMAGRVTFVTAGEREHYLRQRKIHEHIVMNAVNQCETDA